MTENQILSILPREYENGQNEFRCIDGVSTFTFREMLGFAVEISAGFC